MAELPPPAMPQPDAAPRTGKGLRLALAGSGTVNLLVGPEITVTGGIVEIHF